MTHTQPAQTARRRSRLAAHAPAGCALFLGAVIAVLLVVTALAAAGSPANDNAGASSRPARPRAAAHARTPAVRWPARGQAALVIGRGKPQASPHQTSVPIASVAKVMTAYLVLERYPLTGARAGFSVTVTAADARAEARDAAEDQSVAAVRASERLTERQMLEELLLPSANNIARMLAVRVGGSEKHFIAQMNAEARSLGMKRTTYTDPSGWDQGTVSTAADQLRIFRQAMRFPVFRQILSMPSATLPVAGTLTSTNPVLAEGYYGKTGSDTAAGACLAFFTRITAGGRPQTAVGVVLGQWAPGSTSVDLTAAGQAAEQLIESIAPASSAPTVTGPPGRARVRPGPRVPPGRHVQPGRPGRPGRLPLERRRSR